MKNFLLSTLLSLLPVLANAYDAEIDGIYYNFSGNEATVTFQKNGKSDYSGDVVIPGSVIYNSSTYIVTRISESAFSGCSGLTSITIPNSVTSIGGQAFRNCRNLTSIKIPNSVTSIGSHAFYRCSGLTSIKIPNSVTSIGSHAFYRCSGLTSITIPNSVTSIGVDAFEGTSWYDSQPDGLIYAGKVAYKYKGEMPEKSQITIKKGTLGIAGKAFEFQRGLKSIKIPESVTSIEDGAFYGCYFGYGSFVNNTKLTSDDNWGATLCNEMSDGLLIKNDTVVSCRPWATSVSIPDYVTAINAFAFSRCYLKKDSLVNHTALKNNNRFNDNWGATLYDEETSDGLLIKDNVVIKCRPWTTSVTIPKGVTEIKYNAFTNCRNLKSIKISKSVVIRIANGTFSDCRNLKSIKVERGNPRFDSRNKCNAIIETKNNTLIAGCKNSVIPKSVTAISQSAFKGCSGLKSIVIPDSVTSIGGEAFDGCSGLKSITIPDSVTSIGYRAFEKTAWYNSQPDGLVYVGKIAYKYKGDMPEGTQIAIKEGTLGIAGQAFSHCNHLTSITIPESVTNIGNDAFEYCDGLTSITIPKNVNYISSGAFNHCDRLSSVTINCPKVESWFDSKSNIQEIILGEDVTSIGPYAFWNCSGLKSIKIPESVTSIEDGAFYGCSGLTSVIIPESVTSIGNDAFGSCSGLTSVIIPESVTSIGRSAFYGCSGLKSITIPQNVTSIGRSAFYGCSGLKSITIPKNVTSIGGNAFGDCSGLTSIKVEEGNATYDSRENSNAIMETATNTLIVGCQNTVIPESVTLIGNGAFGYCSGLTSIIIPESVTSIDAWAFVGCSGLTSITIPESVTSIGYRAFEKTAWYNSQPDGLVYAGKVAYKYKGDMPEGTQIAIKEGTLGISGQAFSHCNHLTSITIPESVTNIGNDAFEYCDGLTSITIPKNVNYISSGAFNHCDRLSSVTINCPKVESWFDSKSNIQEIILGEDVTSIGPHAFWNCSGLTSINIPNSVTSIGDDAFYGCSGLTSVIIPESVTSIGNDAFGSCSGLTSVIIPESVTSIGDDAFYGCSGLTSVIIPESVTSIGRSAFYRCSGLKSITIPQNVTSIGRSAFYGCSGLKSITIPQNVTSIGGNAFGDCSGLTSIKVEEGNATYDSRENSNAIMETATNTLIVGCQNTVIPESVTLIGNGAFWYCSGLTSIIIPESVTSIDAWAFVGCSGLTSITIPESVTSIGGSAFSECSGLTSITIPNSVTSIGGHAFRNCRNLTSITIPNSVTSIGKSTFYGCNGLTSIKVEDGNTKYDSRNNCNAIIETATNTLIAGCQNTVIPNSVTSIGDFAFYCCTGLTSISIHSVTSIGKYAFYCCSGLASIDIPESVTDIGGYAFYDTPWYDSQPDGLVYAGKVAYKYKGNMPDGTQITIKEGTIGIADNAFLRCDGLTSIIIPESVTSIGIGAFYDCKNLTSVNIPESVTSIGDAALGGTGWYYSQPKGVVYAGKIACGYRQMPRFANITIKKGTIGIAGGAFEDSDLSSVNIPASVISIGERAFFNCRSLRNVYCLAEEVPQTGSNAFKGSNIENTTLHVPAASIDKYKTAKPWSDFGKIVAIER